MSSFNNIAKVTYQNDENEVVSLLEYILFEDERTREKYLVFKFNNNLNQKLTNIEFEVNEFDLDGDLIEKAILKYGDTKENTNHFIANGNSEFVPSAKLRANYNCNSIQVVLKYARFERVYWSENEFKPVTYNVSSFREDYSKKPSEPKPIKAVKVTRAKKKDKNADKRLFKVNSIMHRNNTRLPNVLLAISILVLCVFTGVSLYFFGQQNREFVIDGYQYEVLDSKSVQLVDYDGDLTFLSVPKKAMDFKVTKIGQSAFEGSNIEMIEFNGAIEIERFAFKDCKNLVKIAHPELVSRIGDYAFENCESLRQVSFDTAERIGEGAFKGCTSLVEANLPVALCSQNVFNKCSKLVALNCKDTNVELYKLFGDNEKDIPAGFQQVTLKCDSYSKDYFKYMDGIRFELINSEKASFEYGSLRGLNLPKEIYNINDSMEVYNGRIISFNNKLTYDNKPYLHIASGILDLKGELNRLNHIFSNCEVIKIDPQDYVITADTLASLSEVNTLIYNNKTKFDTNAFMGFSRLNTLVIDSNDDVNGVDVNLPYVQILMLDGDGSIYATNLQNSVFNFGQIYNLYVDDNVELQTNALQTLTGLNGLVMPLSRLGLKSLGVSQSLTTLYITKNSNITVTPAHFIEGYYNLVEVNLPDNLDRISSGFISNAPSLRNVKLPTNIVVIGDSFMNSVGVYELTLPKNLVQVGNDFIVDCPNLYNVNFNNSFNLAEVGRNLISNCPSYKNITLPQSVKTINSYLFSNQEIDGLTIPAAIANSPAALFFNNANRLQTLFIIGDISAPNLSNLTGLIDIRFFGKVSNVNKGLFAPCSNLRSLEIESDNGHSKLADLLASNITTLEKVVISKPTIDNAYFEGLSINMLAIKNADAILEKALAGLASERIFITSKTERNALDYSLLNGVKGFVATDGEFTRAQSDAMNQFGIKFVEHCSYDQFINSYYGL